MLEDMRLSRDWSKGNPEILGLKFLKKSKTWGNEENFLFLFFLLINFQKEKLRVNGKDIKYENLIPHLPN